MIPSKETHPSKTPGVPPSTPVLDTSGATHPIKPKKKPMNLPTELGVCLSILIGGPIAVVNVGPILFNTVSLQEAAAFVSADLPEIGVTLLDDVSPSNHPSALNAIMKSTDAAQTEGIQASGSRVWEGSSAYFVELTSDEGEKMECIVTDETACTVIDMQSLSSITNGAP